MDWYWIVLCILGALSFLGFIVSFFEPNYGSGGFNNQNPN